MSSFRKYLRFLGPKVSLYLLAGIAAGFGMFLVEVAFAYGLQSFLLALGIAQAGSIVLPDWVPQGSFRAVLVFLFVTGAARAGCQWASTYLQGASPAYFLFEQRSRLFHWALSSRSVSGAKLIGLFNERTTMAAGAIMFVQSAIVQASTALLLGAMLLYLAPAITIVIAVFLIFLALPVRIATRKVRAAGNGLNLEGAKLNARLILSIKNLLLLRIYGMQAREEKLAQGDLRKYLGHYVDYSRSNAVIAAAPQLFGVALICMISVIGKLRGDVNPGVLISYFYLFTRFMQSVTSATNTASSFIFHWPQLRELFEWSSENPQDSIAAAPASPIAIGDIRPGDFSAGSPIGWRVEGLDFRYGKDEQWLFRDFSARIAPGTTTVIIGPSGVGKSTLLGLILGEATPTRGRILVEMGGREEPLQEADSRFLSQIGYVGAESFMVEGTLYENLTYGLLARPAQEEIDAAIEKAECHFIREFPAGLQHFLTEQGQGLSAGQKQRLSLARALLRKPKALILDEATSNLDPATEEKLVATLAGLKSEFTIVAVTHRRELLKIADQTLDLKSSKGTD